MRTFQEIRQFPEQAEPWAHETHVHAKMTEGAIVVTCYDTLNVYTPGTDPELLRSVEVDSLITKVGKC